MPKILFVNVVNEFRKRNIELESSNLGISYLASYLRKYGDFNDITILNAGQSLKANFLKNFDVIGLSSVTQNFNVAKQVAKEAKREADPLVLVGGHHISALPSNLTEDMDVAVLGEGEQTTLELMQGLKPVAGVAFKSGKKLIVGEKRELIRPLDKIPFPARDLLHLSTHFINMLSSRGCPYKCRFCSSSNFWGTTRFFSAKYVVSEITHIVNTYKPKRINFADDLFIANKVRLRKIKRLIQAEELQKRVEFHCTARANLVDDEVASLLRSMNVKNVSMGLESGSDRILQYLKGDSVSVEQNEKAIKTLQKHGLTVSGSFIIGSPTETEKEIMQTYRFIQRSRLDGGETYVLLPFPKTPVWKCAEEKGDLTEFMDWNRFEIYFEDVPNRILLSETLSRSELLGLLLKFKKLWRKKHRATLFKEAVKHPSKILPFVRRRLGVHH